MELYKAKYSDKKKSSRRLNNRTQDKFSKRPSRSYRNSRNDRDSKYSRDDRRHEMFDATCGDCGIECKIPFEPKFNRPVFCSRCYEKNSPQQARGSRNDRYSNNRSNDRYSNNRYSNNRSSQDEHLSKSNRYDTRGKSKKEKSLRKHESFYSDGSEKFYASLKEKLFEILGGKTCSSCGFRDERALGFNHIYDGGAFDRIRRGGFASSWGKYISEPELARKELKVLCLNCNEISQPQSKPEPKKQKIEKKKSRYFPR